MCKNRRAQLAFVGRRYQCLDAISAEHTVHLSAARTWLSEEDPCTSLHSRIHNPFTRGLSCRVCVLLVKFTLAGIVKPSEWKVCTPLSMHCAKS
jgi:hypothetical protein